MTLGMFKSHEHWFYFKLLTVFELRQRDGNTSKGANDKLQLEVTVLQKLVWRLFQESVHKSSSNFEAYWSPARGDWLFLLFWLWNTTFSTLNYEWYNWRKLIPRPFGFVYLAWNWFIAPLYWFGILNVVIGLVVIVGEKRFGGISSIK